jgi:D-cysteine desulfhydrase
MPLKMSSDLGVEIFVKRDDLTGAALSGNKVRKLEFLFDEAIDREATRVFTCGGIQSNHARATAIAAARLGMTSRLYLRGTRPDRAEGNVLLDRMVGAEIVWVTPGEYREIDARMAEDAAADDAPVYVIPEGGSNAVGSLGYARAVEEIVAYECESGHRFDHVVHACGSGGTLAGLIFGKRAHGLDAKIAAVNVCDDEAFFVDKVTRILAEMGEGFGPEDVHVLDGYVGPGYAQNVPEDLETIRHVARTEGLFLDPVYTGKAFRGMLEELRGGRLAGARRVLFIHTGGIFGLFPRADDLVGA